MLHFIIDVFCKHQRILYIFKQSHPGYFQIIVFFINAFDIYLNNYYFYQHILVIFDLIIGNQCILPILLLFSPTHLVYFQKKKCISISKFGIFMKKYIHISLGIHLMFQKILSIVRRFALFSKKYISLSKNACLLCKILRREFLLLHLVDTRLQIF